MALSRGWRQASAPNRVCRIWVNSQEACVGFNFLSMTRLGFIRACSRSHLVLDPPETLEPCERGTPARARRGGKERRRELGGANQQRGAWAAPNHGPGDSHRSRLRAREGGSKQRVWRMPNAPDLAAWFAASRALRTAATGAGVKTQRRLVPTAHQVRSTSSGAPPAAVGGHLLSGCCRKI